MSGFLTGSSGPLIRAQLWSNQIKEQFDANLMGTKYVDMLSDFPDGDLINIPSIGQAETNDYVEGGAIQYNAMDLGNFQFSVDQYKSAGSFITEKMKQDSFYANRLMSMFVPKMSRALAAAMETKIMSVIPDSQVAGNANQINTADHRWVAGGTNETIRPEDFAKANYAFDKANAPAHRVAIVDPSAAYALDTLTNLSNVSNNPRFEGIVSETMRDQTGMVFLKSIYGFDVYVSNFLKKNVASETIGARTSTVGVNNLFMALDASHLPIVGLVRQAPKVDAEFNKDLQREEYVVTCRYGFKTYRPECVVTVVSDTDQVV
jgi:hypothetical protein